MLYCRYPSYARSQEVRIEARSFVRGSCILDKCWANASNNEVYNGVNDA
jgi:hypothetical protein